MEKLDLDGLSVSNRTLQRYLEQLRNELGFEILYDSTKGKYHLQEDDLPNVATYLKMVQSIQTAYFTKQILAKKNKIFNHIDIDSGYYTSELNTLPLLLKAILQQRLITTKHANFLNEKITNYTLQPYLLKEYQYRWYLVAIDNATGNIRNFGIERLVNIEVLTAKFKPTKDYDFKKLYVNTIGINYGDTITNKVVFTCNKILSKYLQTAPIHSSQKLIQSNTTDDCFCIEVTINTELKQRLMALLPNLTVLEPSSLKQEIIIMLKASIDKHLGQ
jgi:predicted DNA-binding transcriptional regulator YafY